MILEVQRHVAPRVLVHEHADAEKLLRKVKALTRTVEADAHKMRATYAV